ncbi:hypothetical protein CDL15_Pgr004645 [Punica granatum]|uniref:Uncharacterized protein n=1 Tax=Punica granatum TaxID=22663 RepID=A0A218WRT2_PUNGR|nr:hypothetical protein CDL15_Pgr004645 [Punica granatum]
MPLSRNIIHSIGLTGIKAVGPSRRRSEPNRSATQALGRGERAGRASELGQALELGRARWSWAAEESWAAKRQLGRRREQLGYGRERLGRVSGDTGRIGHLNWVGSSRLDRTGLNRLGWTYEN